jgi:hypothetical protein
VLVEKVVGVKRERSEQRPEIGSVVIDVEATILVSVDQADLDVLRGEIQLFKLV